MGLLDMFKKRSANSAIKFLDSSKQFESLIAEDSYIPLNKHPDILIAVDKIADLVSNMTIHLMENTEQGDIRIRDELARKIDIEPCKYMTRKTWLYKIVKDLLLDGDGNSVIHVGTLGDTGLIGELTPFPMTSVQFIDDDDGYHIEYNNMKYQADEVIHFVINPNPLRPYIGTGYRVALREIAKNLNQATQTKSNFMRSKNVPSLVVKVHADAGELAEEEGRKAIMKQYLETSRAGEPWVIPAEMMDVVQVKPLSLKDIAINESVEIDKKTVAGLIGVPAFFLGVGQFNKDEYNNFINTRILSIAQVISQTLTRDLLISPSRYFKLNPRSLYSYNITELVSAGSQMVQLAALRRNELRDWIGLAPDPDMQDIIVLENYLNQDDLGNQKKLKGGENDESN